MHNITGMSRVRLSVHGPTSARNSKDTSLAIRRPYAARSLTSTEEDALRIIDYRLRRATLNAAEAGRLGSAALSMCITLQAITCHPFGAYRDLRHIHASTNKRDRQRTPVIYLDVTVIVTYRHILVVPPSLVPVTAIPAPGIPGTVMILTTPGVLLDGAHESERRRREPEPARTPRRSRRWGSRARSGHFVAGRMGANERSRSERGRLQRGESLICAHPCSNDIFPVSPAYNRQAQSFQRIPAKRRGAVSLH